MSFVLHKSSDDSLQEGSVTPSAEMVHSPPKRLGCVAQNVLNVSKPLSSGGGSSLKIIMRRVRVYRRTSSQPFDVIIAPERQRRTRDGGDPDIAAIREDASGIVQTT